MSHPPWQSTGYWSTLGLKDNATLAEVRLAYKKLALKHHPDKIPPAERDQATEKFKEIKNAYDFCFVSATIRPEHEKQQQEQSHSSPWYDDSTTYPDDSSTWYDDSATSPNDANTSSDPPKPPPRSHTHVPSYTPKSNKPAHENYSKFPPPASGPYKPRHFDDADEDDFFTHANANPEAWVNEKLANKTWRHAINKKHLDLFLARKRLETFQRQMDAAGARAPIEDRPKYSESGVRARRKATKAVLDTELEGMEEAEREDKSRRAKKSAAAPKGVLPGDKVMIEEGYMRDRAGNWQKATAHAPVQGDGDEPVDFQRGRAVRIVATVEEEEFWDS